MFNSLLRDAGIPAAEVRLLRHKDQRAAEGRSIYELWRDNREAFERYQSTQRIKNRPEFNSAYGASFVGTPADETLFAGLYRVEYKGLLDRDMPLPHMDGVDVAGTCDLYGRTVMEEFADFDGRLLICWGSGLRSWDQRADNQNKLIVELRREFKEPEFPGFLNFLKPLSSLDSLPRGWCDVLKSSRGVYLMTCPKTKEQYVGSATGSDGFWGRWQQYMQAGHGGNVALRSQDPSDYQVSILEVAGTALTFEEVLAMESRWKQKLQSREMGLNRN